MRAFHRIKRNQVASLVFGDDTRIAGDGPNDLISDDWPTLAIRGAESAVTYKDNRGADFGIKQGLRGGDHGVGHRCFA